MSPCAAAAIALVAGALAGCGPVRAGFDAAPRDVARDDPGAIDARDGSLDASLDARPDALDARADAPRDIGPEVIFEPPRDADREELPCSDPCTTNDECAARCGSMSGGVFCCTYSAADPRTPGTCYFSATPACGDPVPVGPDDGLYEYDELGDDAALDGPPEM